MAIVLPHVKVFVQQLFTPCFAIATEKREQENFLQAETDAISSKRSNSTICFIGDIP